MKTLLETQQQFVSDLLDGKASGDYLARANITANELLNIYRNNFFQSHSVIIAKAFPCLKRLVGREYLRRLAREFVLEVPHAQGCLSDFGSGFADFLERAESAEELPYLADVAKLEWAMSESANAACLVPFAKEQLRGYHEKEYPDLRVVLDPSFRLVSSNFPIYDIWSLKEHDADLDLSSGGQSVAVYRADSEVYLRLLSRGQAYFLQELGDGGALAAALDLVSLRKEKLDFAAFFELCLQTGIFLGIRNNGSCQHVN